MERLSARAQAGRQNGAAIVQTTVSRRRPRARRRLITARPPRLDMRLRNPCSRLRGIRFGWYVRFGIKSLATSRDTRARWSKSAGQVVISIGQYLTRLALSRFRRRQIHCGRFIMVARRVAGPGRRPATRLRTEHIFSLRKSPASPGSHRGRRARLRVPIWRRCRVRRCRRPAP